MVIRDTESPTATDRQGKTRSPPKKAASERPPMAEDIRGTRPRTSVRRHSTGNFSISHYRQRNIETDFAVADALQRVGRKINEDYPDIGEYIGSIGEEFQRMARCRVYMALRQKARENTPSSLERRLEVWRDGDEWCIDDTAGHLVLPPDEIFHVFAERTPTVIDGSLPLRLVFGNMDLDDDRCEPKNESAQKRDSSLAMMPFYYRDRRHASGIVLFEGDLRCKDSKVTGFSQTYWTARLAMEMASQLSYKLTHEFDAITTLRRVQDFEVDIRHGIQETAQKGKDLCLLLIDLDNFKQINEGHGIHGGNAVLREVAEAIKSSVRPDDSATRYGGDEFTVILRNVSWEKALEIAQRILDNITNMVVSYNEMPISVGCSIGMVDVRKLVEGLGLGGYGSLDDSQVEHVYDSAFVKSNGLLDDAKREGKGRILCA